jgi:hypothetical protein
MHRNIAVALAAAGAILLTAGVAFAGPAITTVPEPESLSLLAGGLGVLALVRYLRSKK